MGSFPGSGRSPGGRNDSLLQYSFLENLMSRGAWRATVHRILATQSWTQLKQIAKLPCYQLFLRTHLCQHLFGALGYMPVQWSRATCLTFLVLNFLISKIAILISDMHTMCEKLMTWCLPWCKMHSVLNIRQLPRSYLQLH